MRKQNDEKRAGSAVRRTRGAVGPSLIAVHDPSSRCHAAPCRETMRQAGRPAAMGGMETCSMLVQRCTRAQAEHTSAHVSDHLVDSVQGFQSWLLIDI